MDADSFRLAVEQVFNELPDRFLALMENVSIVTEDFASADTLVQMGADSPFELLGIYEGVPLGEQSSADSGRLPDMIRLYRQPILAMQAESGESISSCIRHVLVHEIGHHFGFSDAEMAAIEGS